MMLINTIERNTVLSLLKTTVFRSNVVIYVDVTSHVVILNIS